MENKTEEDISAEWLNDLPLQAENPAFKPDEMISCEKCERANPPTRANCLYCGEQLPISEIQGKFFKPNLRRLETWEKGFNLVLSPDSKIIGESEIENVSSILKIEKEMLREMFSSKNSLPLARIETRIEAETVQKHLLEIAVDTKIIADEDLKIEKTPRRLRAMDFWDDKLVLIFFNADEIAEFPWEDVSLIVTGAIFVRKVQATEARGKKGENKLLATNETASDEILIDIYSRQDAIGYRVEQKGFDFSCLGAEKSLLAAENIRLLVRKLSERAPNAKIVEDYLQIRPFLANVWEVEERKNSQGMKRERFGKFNLENITTVSNAAQFTKYSRLQRHLL